MSILPSQTACMVLVTLPNDPSLIEILCKLILENKAAACITALPAGTYHYWWQGKIEADPEVQLILKTHTTHLQKLYTLIREKHPYEIFEFLVMGVQLGSEDYLTWMHETLQST